MPLDFVAIDFETANESLDSACSVGLVKVKNSVICDSYYSLINPESEFNPINVHIHGITYDAVKNYPSYPTIFKQLIDFCDGLPLVAHYAPFDMNVMVYENRRYKIMNSPDISFFDSYFLSKFYINNISYRLNDLSKLLDINLSHHNALSDSEACAKIILKICKQNNIDSLDELLNKANYKKFGKIINNERFGFLKSKSYAYNAHKKHIDVNEIISSVNRDSLDSDHIFFNAYGCFTGKLINFTRQKAMIRFANLGGIPERGVTKKTNFLIMGEQDIRVVGEDKKSSKIKRAETLLSNGQNIQLLGENDFIRFVSTID